MLRLLDDLISATAMQLFGRDQTFLKEKLMATTRQHLVGSTQSNIIIILSDTAKLAPG
jgi:hypothetical protein